MKWFQLDAATTDDPRLVEIISRVRATRQDTDPPDAFVSMVVYGVLLATWCFTAKQDRARPGWCEYGDQRPIPPAVAADAIRVALPLFEHVMSAAADVGHIDPDGWRNGLIRFPAMERRADTYSQKRMAGYYEREGGIHPDLEDRIQPKLADQLVSGQWVIEGYQVTDVAQQVRIGSGYADLVADTVEGVKLVIEVKRSRVTKFAIAQVVNYCRQMEPEKTIPIVVGYMSLAPGVRPSLSQAELYTYDRSLNVKCHKKSHAKSADHSRLKKATSVKKSVEKSHANTPVPVSVPVVGDLLGEEEAPQVGALVTLWNTTRSPGPKVQGTMTATRQQRIRAALKAYPNLTDWKQVIQWVNSQPWMNAPGTGDHPTWRADLDFLAKPGNLAKYLERARLDQATRTGPIGRDATKGRTGVEPKKYAHLRDDLPA